MPALTAKQKRGVITAVAAMLGAVAVALGAPADVATTIATAAAGVLLGWAHLAQPKDAPPDA